MYSSNSVCVSLLKPQSISATSVYSELYKVLTQEFPESYFIRRRVEAIEDYNYYGTSQTTFVTDGLFSTQL